MSQRIEKIISNLEESFKNLNTSVEQLQKAENIASSSVLTTSTLITEFKSSIEVIEKLVKNDFANEYNKVVKINKDLIARIDKIDFDKKFNDINQKIDDKNFDEDFKSIFDFVSANNDILDSFQLTVIPDGFTNVITAIANKNFDKKFQSVEQKIIDKNFDSKFQSIQDQFDTQSKENRQLEKLIYIAFALIIVCAIATIFFLK